MGFVLKSENTVKWPVKVNIPQDGGTTQTVKFTVEYLLLAVDAASEITSQAEGDTDAELLKRTMRDWNGVKDEEGAEIEFSDEARDQMLAVPFVRRGLLLAYFEAASGKAAGKN